MHLRRHYLQKDGPSAMPCAPGQAGSMQCLTWFGDSCNECECQVNYIKPCATSGPTWQCGQKELVEERTVLKSWTGLVTIMHCRRAQIISHLQSDKDKDKTIWDNDNYCYITVNKASPGFWMLVRQNIQFKNAILGLFHYFQTLYKPTN